MCATWMCAWPLFFSYAKMHEVEICSIFILIITIITLQSCEKFSFLWALKEIKYFQVLVWYIFIFENELKLDHRVMTNHVTMIILIDLFIYLCNNCLHNLRLSTLTGLLFLPLHFFFRNTFQQNLETALYWHNNKTVLLFFLNLYNL